MKISMPNFETPSAGVWRTLLVLGLVGAVWLTLGAADWLMRFSWFRWQGRVIHFSAVSQKPAAKKTWRFVTNNVPTTWGGDLTRLIALPAVTKRFEQAHPGGLQVLDAEGFRNFPLPGDVIAPIVVVGDSFMASGEPMTNMFSARLTALSGLPVLNRAMVGHGPFESLSRFLDSELFREKKPKILIWGFIEREVIRHGFSGLVYQLDLKEKGRLPPGPRLWRVRLGGRTLMVNGTELSPGRLRTSLPDTSLAAQLSRRMWNRLRYLFFGVTEPEVFVAEGLVEGWPLLFYRPALRVMLGDPSERNPDEITWAIGMVRDFLAKRGVRLVVVMVPDKEQVYRELIPPRELEGRELPPSCFWTLEERLRAEGIPVVNLLRPFRARAERGELLYWADDTHWNERGIQIAVDETWKVARELLYED